MIDRHSITVVAGGYRADQSQYAGPLTAQGIDHQVVRNDWVGPGDSLVDRVDRLVQWNRGRVDSSTPVHLVALSMGCHVAVRAGQVFEAVGDVVLVAPDPKARPVARDTEEAAGGTTSAFEEARALWGGVEVPSVPFTDALITLASRARRLRIIYCRSDGVAEWDGNVDRFIVELARVVGVELIEAVDEATVTISDVTIDLTASGPGDVHERLWSATRL